MHPEDDMTGTAPDGYAGVIPFLVVRDMKAAIVFCESVLAFERSYVNEQDGRIIHAELAHRGRTVVMLAPEGAHGPSDTAPATRDRASFAEILVYVEDVDASHRTALEAGATATAEPADQPWGERIGNVTDPDGYRGMLVQTVSGTSPGQPG